MSTKKTYEIGLKEGIKEGLEYGRMEVVYHLGFDSFNNLKKALRVNIGAVQSKFKTPSEVLDERLSKLERKIDQLVKKGKTND